MPVIDIHSHYVPRGMPDLAVREGDQRWPTLVIDDGGSRIVADGRVYRETDESYYSLDARVAQMDELGIDEQILSPLPVMLPYWADPRLALESCRAFNELVLEGCAEHPGRFRALGSVPLQDPARAAAELERVKSLGLVGVEVGTWLGEDLRLADEAVRDFLVAAADLDVPVLLHPNAPHTFAESCTAAIELGVGVGAETARAMASLHLAGSLPAAKGLRLCMSHGGGAFLWLWPRFKEVAARAGVADVLPDGLFADTVGLDADNLAYVVGILGEDRLMFGSDLPATGTPWTARALAAVRDRDTAARMCTENVEAFLGTSPGAVGPDGGVGRCGQR